MKKYLLLFTVILISSCISVKKHNQQINNPINPKLLQKDTDFALHQLEKLHPQLYWYISKENLHQKFSQLKNNLTKPINSKEYYSLLAPIISEVKEGHLTLIPPTKKYTKREIKYIKHQKGLLGRFTYLIDENRLYIKENKDKFANIPVGTEILAIGGTSTEDYIKKYKPFITGDGFNETYNRYSLARRLPDFITLEKGILDSIKIKTAYLNEVKEFYIHREKTTDKELKAEKKKIADSTDNKQNRNQHFNAATKNYNRELKFLDQDSTIAYVKIRSFSGVHSSDFYKSTFKKIDDKKAQYLVIDVRDNLGGSLNEIRNLYQYLTYDTINIIKPIEVTSKSSLKQADYFKGSSIASGFFKGLFYPLYYSYIAGSVKNVDAKYLIKEKDIKKIKTKNLKKNHFAGKIYFLMNGSSFSASSIITSKAKNDGRAILVGEETGGANDGTVAGRYATQKLPNSKLKLPIGLMLIEPDIQFSNTKKGVIPDIEIIPTKEDIFSNNDVQLNWILKDIEAKKGNLQ